MRKPTIKRRVHGVLFCAAANWRSGIRKLNFAALLVREAENEQNALDARRRGLIVFFNFSVQARQRILHGLDAKQQQPTLFKQNFFSGPDG